MHLLIAMTTAQKFQGEDIPAMMMNIPAEDTAREEKINIIITVDAILPKGISHVTVT